MNDKCRVHPDRDVVWVSGELCGACENRLRSAQLRINRGLPITPTQGRTVHGMGRWPAAVRARFDEEELKRAEIDKPRTLARRLRGADAYGLRVSSRMTWQQIADRCGFSRDRDAIEAAQRYAELSDLCWPPRVRVTRQEQAYLLHGQGSSWHEAALALDYHSGSSARRAAQTHAKRHGLQWPPPNSEE
jgi:hypothetical protein